jgi:hypothetical protein
MTTGFNEYVKENGGSALHMDENLKLQKEVKKEVIWTVLKTW